MSLVGVFIRSQPSIGGYVFDAVLRESSELVTEPTEFPIDEETGALIGNDHVKQKQLEIEMEVGVSDNVFRQLAASAGSFSTLAGIGSGAAVGRLLSKAGQLASSIGLGVSVANAAFVAGQAMTRSQTALEAMREIQRSGILVDVVSSKNSYKGCLISITRQEITKGNEGGLELYIKLKQMLITNSEIKKLEVPAPGDTSETQSQNISNLGLISVQQ